MVAVLWASPLPPVRSGVSDYTAELLPGLVAAGIRIRLAAPPGWEPSGWRPPGGVEVTAAASAFPRPGELVVAHLGNNPYHEWLLPAVRRGGAVVVLHDLVLHHLLVESTVARDDPGAYRRELEAVYGAAGAALAEGRRWGFTAPRDPFLFPARRWLLRDAAAAVVHSRYAEREVRSDAPDLPVFRVPMGVADPGPADRERLRRELGIAPDEVVLMHLGFLTPAKGLDEVLTAVAAARRLDVPVRLVLVGEGEAADRLGRAVGALGLEGVVIRTGWVDPDRMRRLPAAADLGVVVRRPSAGETSAAALRFLACGTPVAVSALPQFLELPAAVAPRLTPGCETAELVRLLVELAADGDARERRRTVLRYWRREATLERMTEAWVAALERFGRAA